MVISIDKQHQMAKNLFEKYLKTNYESFEQMDGGYLVYISGNRIYFQSLTLKRTFKANSNDVAVFKSVSRGDQNGQLEIILKSAIGKEINDTSKFENDDEIFFSQTNACSAFLYSSPGLNSIILNRA